MFFILGQTQPVALFSMPGSDARKFSQSFNQGCVKAGPIKLSDGWKSGRAQTLTHCQYDPVMIPFSMSHRGMSIGYGIDR